MIGNGLLVTGCYRSGTTLLEKLLHAHPSVVVASQPCPALYHVTKQVFLDELGLQRRYPLDHLFLEDGYTPELLEHHLAHRALTETELAAVLAQLQTFSAGHWTPDVLDAVASFRPGPLLAQIDRLLQRVAELFPRPAATIVGSKEILCEEFLPFLLGAGFKAVIIIRDPRDMIASINFGHRDTGMGMRRPVLYSLRLWRKSVAFALALASRPGFAWLRYEDLVHRPASTLGGVCATLGVSPPERDPTATELRDQYGKAWTGNSAFADVDRISTHSIGQFERLLPADAIRFIETACLPEMRALGYEPRLVRHFERAVLDEYRPSFGPIHPKFPADYSCDAVRLQAEQRRYELLETGCLDAEAERRKWFIRADVYPRLRQALAGRSS
jgi:hypothetical protein